MLIKSVLNLAGHDSEWPVGKTSGVSKLPNKKLAPVVLTLLVACASLFLSSAALAVHEVEKIENQKIEKRKSKIKNRSRQQSFSMLFFKNYFTCFRLLKRFFVALVLGIPEKSAVLCETSNRED